MNTEDTNNVDIDDTNLEDFETKFYGSSPAKESVDEVREDKEEAEEEVVENEDDSLAPDEDEDEAEEEEADEDEDSEEEEEVEEVPTPKQKRNKTQERIEKLVAEARQAERDRDALRAEFEKFRAEHEVKTKEEAPNIREQLLPDAPSPDAVDDKGEPLYELGEFDPKFIRDLTKFTIEQETKAAKAEAAKEAEQARLTAQQDEIKNKWADNVTKAEAELPELREKLKTMGDTFGSIEPDYGEYLATTIMNSDVGPQIMYYLSQNIDEARKIVASGPVAATLALGRLEAKLTPPSEEEKKRNSKQVSKAAAPPEERTRGSGGKFTVAMDTDDLDAFERVFLKK